MSRRSLALLLFALAAGGMIFLLMRGDGKGGGSGKSLTVYCAAGLKKPVEKVATQYFEEYGVEVSLQYGGTGTLLSQIQVAKRGDLFIAADDGSIADARRLEIIAEAIPIVAQHPVIGVAAGNPKEITTIDDLIRPGIRFALASPGAASISRVTQELLGEKWDTLTAGAAVMKPTVTELAADVQLGAVDAAILWDATVPQFSGLEVVDVPELQSHREHARAAVLTACSQPVEALAFARYLAAPDRGGRIFAAHGFQLAGGDVWSEKPEMVLYSGGVNRLAIEKLLKEFADREGVEVTTVFNGCGILCSAMKAMGDSRNPKFPDAYFACDVCFVPPVAEQFPTAVMLTETDIVIAVSKGNPKQIETLADLAGPGLRVGICNAQQSTLGFMTGSILGKLGLEESVRKNVVVEVPTADFLVNQLRAGSLDAIIVYQANIETLAEHFEAVALPPDMAKAVQPFAVRYDSPNRQLAERLLAFFRAHPEEFEKAGFLWRGDEDAVPSHQLPIPEWLKQP
jgi:ABC-type molybdate transport system substrate-binding protein